MCRTATDAALICFGVIMVLAVSFVAPAAWPANGEMREQVDHEDYNELEVPEVIHRRADSWCARWSEPCVVESRMKFSQCCEGLTCHCGGGLFKSGGKCTCKNPSLLGRK